MAVDDERASQMLMAVAKAARKEAEREKAIRFERRNVRWALALLWVGVGLWFLTHEDWLPASATNILRGQSDPSGSLLLGVAVIGFGTALLSFLNLRVHRLGTDRARKQARAAHLFVRIAMGVWGVVAVGLILSVVIGNWFGGHSAHFPFHIVSVTSSMSAVPIGLIAHVWSRR